MSRWRVAVEGKEVCLSAEQLCSVSQLIYSHTANAKGVNYHHALNHMPQHYKHIFQIYLQQQFLLKVALLNSLGNTFLLLCVWLLVSS